MLRSLRVKICNKYMWLVPFNMIEKKIDQKCQADLFKNSFNNFRMCFLFLCMTT